MPSRIKGHPHEQEEASRCAGNKRPAQDDKEGSTARSHAPDAAQEEVLYYGRRMKRDKAKGELWREQLLFEQGVFDEINDNMPERYKKKLEGRLWVPKASND